MTTPATAAAGDARIEPIRGYNARISLPIYKKDGTLITSGTGSSHISVDGAAVLTSVVPTYDGVTEQSECWTLDIPSAHMNGAKITGFITSDATDAIQTPFCIYPKKIAPYETGTARTAGSPSSSQIQLATGASGTTDFYKNCLVGITGSSYGYGAIRKIISYDETTKIATLDFAWGTSPTTSSTYEILQTSESSLASAMGPQDIRDAMARDTSVSAAPGSIDFAVGASDNASPGSPDGLATVKSGLNILSNSGLPMTIEITGTATLSGQAIAGRYPAVPLGLNNQTDTYRNYPVLYNWDNEIYVWFDSLESYFWFISVLPGSKTDGWKYTPATYELPFGNPAAWEAIGTGTSGTISRFDLVDSAKVSKTKTATTSGNWGSTATWEGGIVPVAGDDILIRNVTVSIHQANLDLTLYGSLTLRGLGKLQVDSGYTVATVPADWTISGNAGTVTTNYGTIYGNTGTVVTNNGWMETNFLTSGVVSTNNGTVNVNLGTVTINNGTVQQNLKASGVDTNNANGIVTNYMSGTITTNSGTQLTADTGPQYFAF